MKSIKEELDTTDGEFDVKDKVTTKSSHSLNLIIEEITHYFEYFLATSHLTVKALKKYLKVFSLLLNIVF